MALWGFGNMPLSHHGHYQLSLHGPQETVESLGHDHGGVGVGVKQFFVEWRKENIDCFRVQLLEGLQLLCVEGAQGRQGWNSANQLPGIKWRLDWKNMTRDKIGSCLCSAWRTEEHLLFKTQGNSSGSVERGLPWPKCLHPCGSSA